MEMKKNVAGFISMPQQSVWNNHPKEMDKNMSINRLSVGA